MLSETWKTWGFVFVILLQIEWLPHSDKLFLAEKSQQQPPLPVAASVVPQNLIDSFAQTDLTVTADNVNRDMVDSGFAIPIRGNYKERNISITEEEETVSLSYERPQYITEEDEKPSENQQNEVSLNSIFSSS